MVYESFARGLQRRKSRERGREKYKNESKFCGKCGNTFSYKNVARHEEKCDGIRVICEEDHEHRIINEVFDTVEEAIAFFYDNEYDSEFTIRSSTSKTHKRREQRSNVYVNNVCTR